MKFVNIRYDGKSPYTDRTPLKNHWVPGEVKLVSERDAKTLQGYLEFKRVADSAAKKAEKSGEKDDAALQQAQQAHAQAQAIEQKAKKLTEDTLMEISRMPKEALGDYARQNYGVELDLKSKVGDLRNQVTALVQGGLN